MVMEPLGAYNTVHTAGSVAFQKASGLVLCHLCEWWQPINQLAASKL